MRLLRVGQSLATGTVLRIRRTRPDRLRPLDFGPFAAALDGVAPDAAAPGRDVEVEELLQGASVAGLRAAMDGGRVTSEALTLHLLARIRRLDESLHTLIELNPHALDEARAADRRRRDGAACGPLDGIPVTLKDNIDTAAPMHTTAGAVIAADHVAAADAPLVARLRAAGAVVLGKANLSELAGAVASSPGFSAVGGQTCNPFGDAFSPGGSSSGSAAGVAAGLTVLSVGTETAGSLVVPAAFNGVVAFKPTWGLLPNEGIVPLVATQDTAGPVAGCVADAAALLAVLAGDALGTVSLPADALQGVRVGVLERDILGHRTPQEDTADQADMLARIVDGLLTAGADPRAATVVPDGAARALEASFGKVVFNGLAHGAVPHLAAAGLPVRTIGDLHRFNLAEARVRMPKGQLLADLALLFATDEAAYRAAAADHTRRAAEILDTTFAAAGCDLLASISNCHSSLYATAGYPAASVPIGLHRNGMPTGVTLIARRGDDARLLAWAHAFEQATPHLRPHPTRR